LVKSKTYLKNGDIANYEIHNLIPNMQMEDSFFSWDYNQHPGVKIIKIKTFRKK